MKDSDVSPPSGKWKVFVGALIRVLDKGLDILVPLGMCMIGVLQIFPDYRIKASAADAVIDMSSGLVFIQPLMLFSLSLAVKLFKSANLFPVNHWGFVVGLTASVSCALLVTLIAVTERVDAFLMIIPNLVIWLRLLYVSSMDLSSFEKMRRCIYGLFATSLLLMAFLFPFIFGVKYEMTSIIGLRVVEEVKELEFPDNNHCFRTIVDAYANTLVYIVKATEDFDMTCSGVDVATSMIDIGLSKDDLYLTFVGIETIKATFLNNREKSEHLNEVISKAVTLSGKACVDDEIYTLCIKK